MEASKTAFDSTTCRLDHRVPWRMQAIHGWVWDWSQAKPLLTPKMQIEFEITVENGGYSFIDANVQLGCNATESDWWCDLSLQFGWVWKKALRIPQHADCIIASKVKNEGHSFIDVTAQLELRCNVTDLRCDITWKWSWIWQFSEQTCALRIMSWLEVQLHAKC